MRTSDVDLDCAGDSECTCASVSCVDSVATNKMKNKEHVAVKKIKKKYSASLRASRVGA